MKNRTLNFIYGAILLLVAGAANATVVVAPSEGNYAFSGTGDFSSGSVTITCDWAVAANITGAGTSEANIEITSFVTTGSLFSGCPNFTYSMPWNWVAPASSLGASATATTQVSRDLTDVEVETFFATCIGTLPDAVFANAVDSTNTTSYLYFNGEIGTSGCSLEGTVYATTDVNIYD